MLAFRPCESHGDNMAAEIRLFPCLTDNFGYLIHDPVTKATASIDAPEAAPVIKALDREGWTLTDILITHHHGDHVGGVAELKQKYNCRVVAPHDKSARIANVDLRADNSPTIPTLLAEEKKANVFLRADEPSVAAKLHMKGASAAEVFGELRERKNKS